MVILILLTFYAVGPTQITRRSPTPTREYRYSAAGNAKVSITEAQDLLRALTQLMNPNDLARLRHNLQGITQMPIRSDEPLAEYVATLADFTDNMNEIQDRLNVARSLVASEQMDKAAQDIRILESVKGNTRELLKSLYSLLDLTGGYYGIDTTNQLSKLDELNSLFKTYSKQIDQLASKFKGQQGMFQTFLSLNATTEQVFVNETFRVFGFLKDQNGTALANRNITISWELNQSIPKITDYQGKFEAELMFPIGFPEGPTEVRVSFEPEGSDKILYLPAASVLLVQVVYQRSIMIADLSPAVARPLDYVYIRGNLSSADTKPLENRTITMQLDGISIGDTTTDKNGTFLFKFAVTETISNGTHTVTAIFDARNDRYAPTNATLPFSVELQETRIVISSNPSSLFSGMKLIINGTVNYANNTYDNTTAPLSGEITVYLDNFRYSTVRLDGNASFVFELQSPLGLSFGSHSILVEYAPDIPWVRSTQLTREVFVYNTPLTFVAIAATVTVPVIVGYLVRRSRKMALQSAGLQLQPVVPIQPLADEFTPDALMSKIEAEPDYHRKVATAYALAQALIKQKLGEAPKESETAYEYVSRLTKTTPKLRDLLERLAEIYQLAEYSPYPVGRNQSKEAAEILLELREEIETVK